MRFQTRVRLVVLAITALPSSTSSTVVSVLTALP
jgi:hypothetical protein